MGWNSQKLHNSWRKCSNYVLATILWTFMAMLLWGYPYLTMEILFFSLWKGICDIIPEVHEAYTVWSDSNAHPDIVLTTKKNHCSVKRQKHTTQLFCSCNWFTLLSLDFYNVFHWYVQCLKESCFFVFFFFLPLWFSFIFRQCCSMKIHISIISQVLW